MSDTKHMPWRVGTKLPINVYEGDRPICQCHTALDAKRIVSAVNGYAELLEALQAIDSFWGSDDSDGDPVCPAPIYPDAYLTDQDVPIRDVIRAVVRRAKGEDQR